MRKAAFAGIAAAALTAGSVYADEAPSKPQDEADTKQICRTVAETGSRLKSSRVCMTTAQWAEQRRQDRMLIERSQVTHCKAGSGC